MDKALADANEAIRLDAKDATALAVRGLIYYEQNDLDQAIADFNAALKLDPESVEALRGRAKAYATRMTWTRRWPMRMRPFALTPRMPTPWRFAA